MGRPPALPAAARSASAAPCAGCQPTLSARAISAARMVVTQVAIAPSRHTVGPGTDTRSGTTSRSSVLAPHDLEAKVLVASTTAPGAPNAPNCPSGASAGGSGRSGLHRPDGRRRHRRPRPGGPHRRRSRPGGPVRGRHLPQDARGAGGTRRRRRVPRPAPGALGRTRAGGGPRRDVVPVHHSAPAPRGRTDRVPTHDDPDGLRFTIETWSRAGAPLARVAFQHLRLGKEIQLTMWAQFCLAVPEMATARRTGPVEICTRRWDGPGRRE